MLHTPSVIYVPPFNIMLLINDRIASIGCYIYTVYSIKYVWHVIYVYYTGLDALNILLQSINWSLICIRNLKVYRTLLISDL